ncbi:nodulation efficiency protein D [Clostridium botulinum]|uniref:Nodulation efficiency protein D n=1 Tax=Clostridium botulinum TaxID=1491 RepID=A0AAU8Z0X4_CLOBO|nr:NfeD family protein [Clostridium sporogenes]AVP65511.1 nodulation efficiency protein D [Clostridium botulinum]MCF4015653.1 NfeD family protein [Clostridium sporogenes]NFG02181.1 NfeD family protein [Clostridium sporogenes]
MWSNFNIIIWVIVGTAALLLDLATSSFLFVWFTLGAIAALIAQILGYPMAIQIIVFVLISLLCMVLGYPIVKKIIKKQENSILSIEKNYIGEIFIADKDIKDEGVLRFQGVYWRVTNSGDYIKKGDKVKIISVKGNKIFVEKVEEE